MAIESEVKKGIELLNKTIPDWQKYIDIDRINESSLVYCVIGQIGNRIIGQEINGKTYVSDDSEEKTPYEWMLFYLGVEGAEAFDYGFDCPGFLENEYTIAWKKRCFGDTKCKNQYN